MKIISFDKIAGAGITSLQCYEWVDEVIKNKKDAILPAKISMKTGQKGVFYNTMPSAISSMGGGKACHKIS